MAFVLHTGRTFTGRDGFRVAYRTYAYLAKAPLHLRKFLFFSIGLCLYSAESSLRLLASTERDRGRISALILGQDTGLFV